VSFPTALASARRCRVLAADEDEFERVAVGALDAIDGRWPFEEARTRLAYGERLRRAGRRVDARTQLQAALALFDELGAGTWADHARRELKASGAKLRPRDQSSHEALTPRELHVALAVASGRTNREVGATLFISPKTVELHLSRVFRKLGLRTRAELIRLYATQPTSSTPADQSDESLRGAAEAHRKVFSGNPVDGA
jgi:DNA-binding CsgD family transcriptional regulator